MRPNVYASSTTGVKKSVVRTSPWPPGVLTTAASSPSSSPTTSSTFGAAGPVDVRPATTHSSSPGGILQAHPPPWAYWVRRMRVGAVVTPPNLGATARKHDQPGRCGRRPAQRPARRVPGGRWRAEAGQVVPGCVLVGELGGFDAVLPEPAEGLPLPTPRHQEQVVTGPDEQLRLHLPPGGAALPVPVAEGQDAAPGHGLLDDRPDLGGATRVGADPQAGREQLGAPDGVGLEDAQDLLQRGPAVGGVRAAGAGGEGDRYGRGLLGCEGDRRQRRGAAGLGAVHGEKAGSGL